ncbi:bifunctional DNA-binding transcriptional regulator/O6-methylguanine-DNA methyltransferase Ada [Calidithermus chliarophilus]|uniref:bifunctional DNA-binding transcriptional regulator/O6-methylguanine-DNA methyltransferase Ada n=1 Tax=Calidithermus chliarophilus TaxID=52023 RepID=UPI0004284594|nr:bifunctional DNA-binding transcriptional regulator/O6-methylguanine-DNA methyltransferase Ada [Calidithermus chliarophilus]
MSLSPEDPIHAARWAAFARRDRSADGRFVVAVRSTGIYCRPSCPARRPKPHNVSFFDTPEAAEAAGYRACLRCRPREVPARVGVVQRVKAELEHAPTPPTLAELGRRVGLSPYHLQRLFKQETGLSPREYAAALRLGRLKESLRSSASVTEGMYEAGYGSSHALYRNANSQLGMSPATYRRGGKGMKICYAFTKTPLGLALLAATEKGLCALQFGESREELEALLRAEFAQAELEPGQLPQYVRPILEHLSGQPASLDLPLDLRGTAFQLRVWEALRAIPPGQTRTYGELARDLGDPKAVRAVARACGANPVPLVVPCHRVIGSDGKLTGYRWGLERKRKLLEREQPAVIRR